MKKLFSIVLAGTILAACGGGSAKMEAELAKAKQRMTDSLKTVDSLKNIAAKQQKTVDSLKAIAAKRHHSSSDVTPRYADAEGTTAAPEAKKKGMSGAVKGALIGAGVGAVSGAIIDKKHGEGAIVGGVLGAGAGAATGAILDKNKKKKEATTATKQ